MDRTNDLQSCLNRLRDGDLSAREELLSQACERLSRLAQRMLRDNPRVGRWEECDDVLQNSLLRLHRVLEGIHPPTVRDFFRLAAMQIRRELIDLARHHFGPEGLGANHASVGALRSPDGASADLPEPAETTQEPSRLALWTEFHRQIGALPEESRELFDVLWYQGLTQAEAAGILGIPERTLQRRWQAARTLLHRRLRGDPV